MSRAGVLMRWVKVFKRMENVGAGWGDVFEGGGEIGAKGVNVKVWEANVL